MTLLRPLAAAALAVGLSSAAQAQTAQVLSGCGQASPSPGPGQQLTMGPKGVLCSDMVVQGAAAYAGGTIAVGGTSQAFLAANPARRGFTIQNQSTGDLYVKIGGTATLTNASLRIAPGVLYETPSHHVSTGAVTIIGATTGQAFYATEF